MQRSSNLAAKETLEPASDRVGAVRAAFETTPAFSFPFEVADGIWWIRLPLDGLIDHVNVYVLDDGDGLTLIDTGNNTPLCRDGLNQAFLQPPFTQKKIARLITTHYHPDHIGLAKEIIDRGAALWTTRACWVYARMLQLDVREIPYPEQVEFTERAGLGGMALAAYKRRAPSNFPKTVMPVPFSYTRIDDGDVVVIGKRTWTIQLGNGHAIDHATLWSNDGIAITGDQLLPGISSNLSIHPSEPDNDLVTGWLASCHRIRQTATAETLCLPGHNGPFYGAPARCEQLISSQHSVLKRLWDFLERPATAVGCLDAVYRRALDVQEQGTLIAEVVGFLNHLRNRGLIQRELVRGNAYVWHRTTNDWPTEDADHLRIDSPHDVGSTNAHERLSV
jgi:glyoxylase-like metal-dependent hydrolase (beta-lactamase superfamily II)